MNSDTKLDAAIRPVDMEVEESADTDRVEIHLPAVQDLSICPTFSSFNFTSWSLEEVDDDENYGRLNSSISQSQEERAEHGHHAFDMFAVPEPIDDDLVDSADCDEIMDELSDERLSTVDHRLPSTTADMLSVLTTAPLEYSYFDHGKIGAWAGPKHWKFKPLARLNAAEEEGRKGRKKKAAVVLNYDEFDERLLDVMERVDKFLNLPKKSVKLVDRTMKGWSRERSTLPEDLHYSGHELVRLKTVGQMVVAKGKNDNQLDQVGIGF